MSDIEEPPQKVTKLQLSPAQEEDAEMLDEGQEEWLSEEAYTDEDYLVPTAEQDTLNSSQETPTLTDIKPDISQENQQADENIEETLNNLDRKDLSNLDAFLIRKTDGKVVEPQVMELKVEKDDGNDTDDLLRMLGEENKAKKKLLKVKDRKPDVKENHSSDDDDDNFVFEGATMARLKVAKNALMSKYPATMAVPEDTSDGDDESEQSSDNESTVKTMYTVKRSNVASKSTSKPATGTHKKVVKQVARANSQTKGKPNANNNKSILKTITPKAETNRKAAVTFKALNTATKESVPKPKAASAPKFDSAKIDFDDLSNIDEEEFLDENEFDINEEEFAEESDLELSNIRQRLPRPERMDEEGPEDGDSRSEDGSLYDELPSSDSDELEDWFTIDIRAERAGDYLPLLGSKAYELLSSERRRVSERLATLRESLTSLTESGRKQAEELREATMSLAELDDMLKAS